MPTVHGYPVNDGINCYNPAQVGAPAERQSEIEDQNHDIIKDFPGLFVRPPFQLSPPAPSQEDPVHPFCRSPKFRRGVTRTKSGELVLHAIDARSALDEKECDTQSNAGDSSIGYPDNAGDVAISEDTVSKGQTDMGIAPVAVAASAGDSFRWKLSSDAPEDISLDQLAYSGDLQKNIQESSAQDAPTLDAVAETGDFSAGEFLGGATGSHFTD